MLKKRNESKKINPLDSCSTCREAHDIKDAVQLVMVVRVTGLDIFLATVEYGLRRQQLCKDAANRPDVWKKNRQSRISGCAYAQECRWARVMRNSHRWLWCNAEPRAKAPALCTRKWPPPGQDRLKASAVNWRVGQSPCQLQDGGDGQIRELCNNKYKQWKKTAFSTYQSLLYPSQDLLPSLKC